jgi:cytochrome P450
MSYSCEMASSEEQEHHLADPYPWYRRLREDGPVHYDEFRGNWLVTRYDDIAALLRDDHRLTAEQNGPGNSMLGSDPPRHTRLRTLVMKAFTPRAVRQLQPRIQEIVDELLVNVAGEDQFDVVSQFAYPLPIMVIAELLGVDKERGDFFHAASSDVALALGPSGDSRSRSRAAEGRAQLLGYFRQLIRVRSAEPRDDLVSALIDSRSRGDLLGEEELLGMLILLIIGGHETTANLIGNGLLALLRNPEQHELFRSTDDATHAVEELLRYDSPVQYTGRAARVDFELRGTTIRAGDGVRLLLASGNRDEAAFADPDQLDITRHPCPHLSFGGGIHYCLGAELARLEGRVALSTIVRRFPALRLVEEETRWRPAPVLRGLERLGART